jgi:hypothetical protein
VRLSCRWWVVGSWVVSCELEGRQPARCPHCWTAVCAHIWIRWHTRHSALIPYCRTGCSQSEEVSQMWCCTFPLISAVDTLPLLQSPPSPYPPPSTTTAPLPSLVYTQHWSTSCPLCSSSCSGTAHHSPTRPAPTPSDARPTTLVSPSSTRTPDTSPPLRGCYHLHLSCRSSTFRLALQPHTSILPLSLLPHCRTIPPPHRHYSTHPASP